MPTSIASHSSFARATRAALVGALLIPTLSLAANAQSTTDEATVALSAPSAAIGELTIVSSPTGAPAATTTRGARLLWNNPRPSYPADLAGESGSTVAQFVVDASGHIQLNSISVVQSTDPAFATAVLDVLPRIRFAPARDNGQAVDQTVRMPFVFTGTH